MQLAYGRPNAQLQTFATGATFSYGHQESYSAVCTFTTGEGTRGEKVHNVTNRKSVSVNSTIAYDARTSKRQITGFNLTGFGSEFTETGTLPMVGGFCHNESGGGTAGTWTSVTSNNDLTGSLYVNYGRASVLLP